MDWKKFLMAFGVFIVINVGGAMLFGDPTIFGAIAITKDVIVYIFGIGTTGVSLLSTIWDTLPFPSWVKIIIMLIIIGWVYIKFKSGWDKTKALRDLIAWPFRKIRKSKSWKNFKEKHGRRIVAKFKTDNQDVSSKLGFWNKWIRAEGYEPKSFLDNRILLFALMDYSLRLDIFNTKWHAFDKISKPKMIALSNAIVKYRNKKLVRLQIKDYRSKEPLDIEDVRRNLGDDEIPSYGWTVLDKGIVQSMNRTIELMHEALKINNTISGEEKMRRLQSIRTELLRIGSILNTVSSAAAKSHNQFYGRVNALGVLHHIRSKVLNMYDMQNPMGKYEHDYLFTGKNAKFRIDPYRTYVGSEPAPHNVEVNRFGYEMDKSNRGVAAKKLLNPRDDSEFPEDFQIMLEYLSKEWKGFVTEFREGAFSQQSRTIGDYAAAFEEMIDVHLDDDSVVPGHGGIKFDRRALVNPGQARYWGRVSYNDESENASLDSPYPKLTILGMTAYLAMLIKEREADYETILHIFLGKYPSETGELIETEQQLKGAVRYFEPQGEH